MPTSISRIEDQYPNFRGLNRKQSCLMNVRWQQLRFSMKPNWYGTYEGTLGDNLNLCATYVAAMARNKRGKVGRWRVLNLLDGVLVGYRSRDIPIEDPRHAKIRSIRYWIGSYAQGQYNSGTYEPDTDAKIRSDWVGLKEELRTALWTDLSKRLENRRSPSWQELAHFVRVLGGPQSSGQ